MRLLPLADHVDAAARLALLLQARVLQSGFGAPAWREGFGHREAQRKGAAIVYPLRNGPGVVLRNVQQGGRVRPHGLACGKVGIVFLPRADVFGYCA